MNFSPEIYSQIELFFGCVGVILGFFFGIYFLSSNNRNTKSNLFLAIYLLVFSFRIGKSLFYGYYSINHASLVIFLSLLLTIGPSLWFYVVFLLNPNHAFKPFAVLWHYLPFIFVILFSIWIPVDSKPGAWVFHLALFIHGITYSMVSLLKVLGSKEKDKSEKELILNRWLIILSLGTIVMFLNYVFIFFKIVPYYPSGAFMFSILIISLSIWAIKQPFIFKKHKDKYTHSALGNEKVSEYFEKLATLMKNEKLYLDPELTLTKLSKKIGINSKQLSQVINQITQQNYSQYIASYRVEEAKSLLHNKNYEHYKISSIAFESGFNNISTFNVAFKKNTGITAIQYRKSLNEY